MVDLRDFRKIPNYSSYLISKKGEVYSFKKNKFLSGSVNPAGYTNIRLTSDNGKCVTWGLHRLLCYVYKPITGYEKLTVNHKDGIKQHNTLPNLEWATYQENQEHAGRLGLSPKCTPVSIKNIDTGIVIDFPSAIKCARYLNTSKDTVLWRTKKGDQIVWPDGYQYRLGRSEKEWPKKTEIVVKQNRNKSTPVLVKYLHSNVVKYFNSQKEAADFLNISYSTISTWLSLKDQPVLPKMIQMKLADDKSDWRFVEDPLAELEMFGTERSIKVTCEKTKDVRIFNSCIDACKELNIRPSSLNYKLKSNNSKVFLDGNRYEYQYLISPGLQ
jgi:hypothetical protein